MGNFSSPPFSSLQNWGVCREENSFQFSYSGCFLSPALDSSRTALMMNFCLWAALNPKQGNFALWADIGKPSIMFFLGFFHPTSRSIASLHTSFFFKFKILFIYLFIYLFKWILWCSQSGYHPWKYLAKYGYKPHIIWNYKLLMILFLFLANLLEPNIEMCQCLLSFSWLASFFFLFCYWSKFLILRHKQASQEGFWIKWQHVSNNLSKKLKKLVHKMPLTPPIQIEMRWNVFKLFSKFWLLFSLKKGICNRTFLLFLFSHLCEIFPPKYNGWLKPPKIQRIKSSTDTHMARNNITTHPHLLNTFFWFTLIPQHLLTYCSPILKSKRWSARIKHSKYCSPFWSIFPFTKDPPPPPLHSFVEAGGKGCVPMPEKSVINMIWLLLPVSFWLRNHNDWSRWFAISSLSHLFAAPVLVFWVGLQKKVNN